jgi:hypothetical protein
MSRADLLMPLLIAASAAVYGIFVGRAQASRLRNLHADVSNGTLRGFLALAVVVAIVLASFVF